MCASVASGVFSKANLMAIEVTRESFAGCNWDPLFAAIEQRLNAGQSTKSDEVDLLLQGLFLLKQYDNARAVAALKFLADYGHLMHLLHQARSSNDVQCEARLLVAFLEQRPGAEKPQSIGNSDAGYTILGVLLATDDVDVAKRIVEILRAQKRLDLLFEVVDKRGLSDALILRCLCTVADSEDPEVLFTPDVVQEGGIWKGLKSHLGDDDQGSHRFDKLIRRLCERPSLVEEVKKDEAGFNRDDAGLYLAIYHASSSKSFGEWCREGLRSVDAKAWKAELDEKGALLELMVALMDTGVDLVLDYKYQDAVVEHAKAALGGRKLPNDLVSWRSKVLKALGTAGERKLLRGRLRDEAMGLNGKCGDSFFEMYGEEISDNETLTGEARIVAKLFTPLVREHRAGGLRWLRDVLSNNPSLLKKYADVASVQDFRARLKGEIETSAPENDEGHKLIIDIASRLGIQPEQVQLQNDAESSVGKPEGISGDAETPSEQ